MTSDSRVHLWVAPQTQQPCLGVWERQSHLLAAHEASRPYWVQCKWQGDLIHLESGVKFTDQTHRSVSVM